MSWRGGRLHWLHRTDIGKGPTQQARCSQQAKGAGKELPAPFLQVNMDKLYVILNPRAGRGLAGRRRNELEQALQAKAIPFELVTTPTQGSATALSHQAIQRGYQRLVVVGGDGTLNEVANAVLSHYVQSATRVALGIVPLGTGSDFIKSFEGFVPNDIAGAVARLAVGRTRSIDAGCVSVTSPTYQGSHYFINNLALGIDAHVADEGQKVTQFKGVAVYLVAALRALARYRLQIMTVRFDGTELRRRFLLATVANGRCQGGGFWLTPDARLDDGLFDLCLVEKLRLDQIVRYVPLAMRGKHTTLPHVWMARSNRVEVEYTAPALIITDGERVVTDARSATVTLLPQALDVIV